MQIKNHFFEIVDVIDKFKKGSPSSDEIDHLGFDDDEKVIDMGYHLIKEQFAKGYSIKDFTKKETNAFIRVINNQIVLIKDDPDFLFNWSIPVHDFIQCLEKNQEDCQIVYYFNFPKGKYSEKSLVDFCYNFEISKYSFLDLESIKNNKTIFKLFFDKENVNKNILDALLEPLGKSFSPFDVMELGYIQKSRNHNIYFIEQNNHYFQTSFIPKEITFDDEGAPLKKRYEFTELHHTVEVDLNKNSFVHEEKQIFKDRQYAVFKTFDSTLFEPTESLIYSVLENSTVAPFMGYPNAFDKDGNPNWIIKDQKTKEIINITEKAKSIIKDKDYENLDNFTKAYFDYYFGLNDTDAFEETLDMITDTNNINSKEEFLLALHLEGDFFYKDVYQKLKKYLKDNN